MENLHHFGGLLNWKKKRRKKSQTRAFVEVKPNGCVKVSLENCVHRPPAERSRDIVVVGAGVAGAALAYALGKVIFVFRFSFSPLRDFLITN